MRLTPFSIRYGCSVVLVKQFLVFLTITGSSARGRRKSISLNDGLSLAKPSSLSMCKKNTTGRWAVRYASTSWVTFFSKAGLLRRSQRGPTLNESCASITNNADCETGTLLESSMVSSSKHLQFNIAVGTPGFSRRRPPISTPCCLYYWFARGEYRSCPEGSFGSRSTLNFGENPSNLNIRPGKTRWRK